MKSFMYDTPVKIRKVVVKRRTKPYTIICKKVNWKVTKCNSLLKKFKALLANIKRLFPPFCCDLINCFHCIFQVEVHQTGDHSCLLQLYWNHKRSPVNLQHIFRSHFCKKTSGGLISYQYSAVSSFKNGTSKPFLDI